MSTTNTGDKISAAAQPHSESARLRIIAVIPARYNSSRFEGKPLAKIAGHTMVEWVYRRVKQSSQIDEVYVAVDDPRVEAACQEAGLKYVMTSKNHETSTDRVREVSQYIDADLYICVNGDEPLIDFRLVEKIIPAEYSNDGAYAANLTCKISSPSEVIDPSNIKVVWDRNNEAIFFSRSPIPYPKSSLYYDYYKHIGVLIYNRQALEFFSGVEKGYLERVEDINEMRFIENRVPLKMIIVEATGALSVDTPKDLEIVKDRIQALGIEIS